MQKLTSADQNTDDYPFAVVMPTESGDEDIQMFETASQVLGLVIPDYESMSDDEAFIARVTLAGSFAPVIQTGVIDATIAEGSEIDGEVVEALMDQESEKIAGAVWPDEAPPKVLVATDFAPDTEFARPTGNVVVIEPDDELTFLRQIAQFGMLRLFEKNVAPEA